MSYNMNGGWGRIAADSVFSNRPNTGKKFLVIASTNANWDKWSQMNLPTDPATGAVIIQSTLQGAIDAVTDSGNDTIYVAPGHSETVTAAGGLAFSSTKTGVSVVGLGLGNQRPIINFTTAAGADIDVNCEGVTFDNMRFDLTGVDALTAPLDINDAYCSFLNCEFLTADVDGQTVLGILTDANADGLTVRNCYFKGSEHAGTTTAIRIVGGIDHVVENNVFIGAYTSGTGAIDNASLTAVDRTLIKNNFIWNTTEGSTKAMVWAVTSTVIITGNNFQVDSGNQGGSPVTAAIGSWVGNNFYATVVATSVLMGTAGLKQ